MQTIQYGDVFGVFTDEGELIEGGFGSRAAANEAREKLAHPAPVAVADEDEAPVSKHKKRKAARYSTT